LPNDARRDLVLFGVFDGHAGWQTSRLVAEKLVQYVVRELHAVFGAAPEYEQMRLDRMAADTAKHDSQGKLGYLARLIKGGGVVRDQRGLHLTHLDQDDAIVQQAIKNAFLKLDDDICQAPVKELANAEEGASARRRPILPSTSQTLALQSLLPALSGSCALLSYLDTARNKLHVACTGDSRAIMGTLQADGKWKVQVLSEDQTGRSAKEVARMQAEHPASEKDTVISRGRVLGGLEPTRAFGDAVYKYEPGGLCVYAQRH
jgi:pyruvate dehydrogenase phosphatase